MQEHVQVGHKKVHFCCFFGECVCKFKTSRGLKYHIESLHKDENFEEEAKKEKYFFSCNICQKGFKFKTQHAKHQLTHETEPKVY